MRPCISVFYFFSRAKKRRTTTTKNQRQSRELSKEEEAKEIKGRNESKVQDELFVSRGSNHLFYLARVTESTWKCLSAGPAWSGYECVSTRVRVYTWWVLHELRMCMKVNRNEQRLDYETVQIEFQRERTGWFERSCNHGVQSVSKRRGETVHYRSEGRPVKSLARQRQFRFSRFIRATRIYVYRSIYVAAVHCWWTIVV